MFMLRPVCCCLHQDIHICLSFIKENFSDLFCTCCALDGSKRGLQRRYLYRRPSWIEAKLRCEASKAYKRQSLKISKYQIFVIVTVKHIMLSVARFSMFWKHICCAWQIAERTCSSTKYFLPLRFSDGRSFNVDAFMQTYFSSFNADFIMAKMPHRLLG